MPIIFLLIGMIGIVIGLMEVVLTDDAATGYNIFGISLIFFFGGVVFWRIGRMDKRIDGIYSLIRNLEKKSHSHRTESRADKR